VGTARPVVAVLVVLLILALLFGVGAVLEGLAWLLLISLLLFAAAVWFGWRKLRTLGRGLNR
jgi:ABC-type nickel/cobalt efflux system permease component RcnA